MEIEICSNKTLKNFPNLRRELESAITLSGLATDGLKIRILWRILQPYYDWMIYPGALGAAGKSLRARDKGRKEVAMYPNGCPRERYERCVCLEGLWLEQVTARKTKRAAERVYTRFVAILVVLNTNIVRVVMTELRYPKCDQKYGVWLELRLMDIELVEGRITQLVN